MFSYRSVVFRSGDRNKQSSGELKGEGIIEIHSALTAAEKGGR